MDQSENSLMRTSGLRQPSRIPSPGKALSELPDSQNNVRAKPSMLPPPTSLKNHNLSSSVRSINEPEPKRKTLAERAGEPYRPASNTTSSRSTVKGTSLLGSRQVSNSSSASSRSQGLSRHASSNSLASSVGPGHRPKSSFSNRPQTSMAFNQSVNGRPNGSTSKRPASSMDDPFEADGKRKAWDMRGRLEDVEAMYSELKDTVAGTTLERQNLEESIAKSKIRILELEGKITQLESNNASLESKNTILEAKSASQEANVDMMRQQLLNATSSLDDERRRYRNELEDAERDHRNEVEKLRRVMEDEVERLKRTHDRETDDEIQRLRRNYDDKIEQMERRNNTAVEDEHRRHQLEIQEIKAQIAVEQQNLDLAVGNKDREIYNMRSQLEELRGELDQELTVKNALQKSLIELKAELDHQKLEMEKMSSETSSNMQSLRAHVEFLESGNKAQSDSFVRLERELKEARQSEREWKDKLVKEETLRRILFNQVQELKGNIRVMCRVRPTFGEGDDDIAKISYPDLDKESKELELQGPEEKSSLGNVTRKLNAFSFDRVFGPSSQNEEVFGEISQLVQSALDGYNVCIFCYGQTGAGKTYTMSSADGMIPRATHMIYSKAESLQEKGWVYTIEGSFVEVYNEEIHDLLGNPKEFDKKKHEIRHDDQRKQTTITNIKTVPLESANTVESILKQAAANRSVAATKSNERSSRSHSVFILKLVGRNETTNETSEGTLNLVDLAGSERLKQSGAEGDRMKETQNINKSLSCLGDVIGALGQGKEGAHIPYRNSKLTYLLQYSLGGNSKTLMFVMISPLEAHLKETLTSLKFATKVHNTHIGTAKKSTKVRDRITEA